MKTFDIILYCFGAIVLLNFIRLIIKSIIFERRLENKNVRVTIKLYDGTIVSCKPNSDKPEDLKETIQAFEKLLGI